MIVFTDNGWYIIIRCIVQYYFMFLRYLSSHDLNTAKMVNEMGWVLQYRFIHLLIDNG